MNIFLLHGNHSYSRKQAKKNLISKYIQEKNAAITSFSVPPGLSPSNIVFQQIRQKLTEESLFAQAEVVMINLLATDKPAKSKFNAETDFITPLLLKIPANIILVVEVPAELPKKSELLKKIQKLKGNIELFKLPVVKDKNTLFDEAKKFLAKEKVKIDSYLVQKLVNDSKGDWWYIFSALEQVVLLSRSKNDTNARISAEEITSLWDLREEQSIFRLFDAIGNGDKASALKLLYEDNSRGSLKTSEDVERTLGLVSLLARQIRQLIAVKSELNPAEAQKNWQIPVFAYSKLKNQANYFTLEFLSQAYEKLTELQEKAKRGLYSPLSLVEFFILYLISHRDSNNRTV